MERQTVTKVPKTATRNHSVQRQSAAPCNRITQLQRSVGNQATQRVINSHYIQAKLQVSSPDDQYEQEADRVADRVMRMPDSNLAGGVSVSNRMQISRVQRKCAACEAKLAGPLVQRLCTECSAAEDKERGLVQGKADSSGGNPLSNGVQSQIDDLRGSGQPLPASARN